MADEIPGEQATSGRRGKSGRGPGARPRPLRVAAMAVAGLVLAAAVGAGYLYAKLNGNILGIDINGALGRDRPANADNGSMDILVLGSDSRSGRNGVYGRDDGSARSDTAMIVHLYKGHKRAGIVSIPRDTLVSRPPCTRSHQRVSPAATKVMFNESYAVGGPACAVKTVEAMTGIRMDHYIEMDFSGFQQLVDNLGGVKVTTTRDIDDHQSHLRLAAGTHVLRGEQALGLVRTRHAIGDGSDLGRIQLQQAFMKALMDQVNGLGLLTSPTKLYSLADTATKAITADTELASVDGLTSLAESLKNLRSGNITMITLPVRYSATDPNRVEPIDQQAAEVWTALRADRPIPGSATRGSAADEVHDRLLGR